MHHTASHLRDDRTPAVARRDRCPPARALARRRFARLAEPEARAIARGVTGDEHHNPSVSERRLKSHPGVAPDGVREIRERKRAPTSARSAAVRWAESRERVLFERLMKPPQDNAPPKEVPTLRAFASRFLDGHARADRQKGAGSRRKR